MRLLHLHYRLCFHPYMILSLSGWTVPHIFSLLPVTADCTGWYNFLPKVTRMRRAYNILRKYHSVSGVKKELSVTGLKTPEIIKVAV